MAMSLTHQLPLRVYSGEAHLVAISHEKVVQPQAASRHTRGASAVTGPDVAGPLDGESPYQQHSRSKTVQHHRRRPGTWLLCI